MAPNSTILLLAIASVLAFSIGLNFGLMGFFHKSSIIDQSLPRVIETSVTSRSTSRPIKVITETETPRQPIIQITSAPLITITPFPEVVQPIKAPIIPTDAETLKVPTGPISAYIAQGKDIPIALLTCNRLELLEQTIKSLLTVNHISKDVIIFQDGAVPGVVDIANKYNLKLVQNKRQKSQLRGEENDGASRIATHYKYSLSTVFEMRPDAPAVIIIEDDLLFSPDFYDYFLSVSPILEIDESAFVISAWSDNGFKGHVQDAYELRRTDYFPGLGWMLTR
jgi:hypothetical protein